MIEEKRKIPITTILKAIPQILIGHLQPIRGVGVVAVVGS
jgi:hypothetical protein